MGALGLGIAASLAFGGAIFLAYHDLSGWGWLIFAGIIACGCASNFASRKKED